MGSPALGAKSARAGILVERSVESSQVTTTCSENIDAVEENTNYQVRKIRKELTESRHTHSKAVARVKAGRCGLRNMGNSCYLSAVMQCLSVVDSNCSYSRKNGRLLQEYGILVRILKDSSHKCVTPSQLKRALGKVDSRFNNQEPQDAHEFLVLMLEVMSEENKKQSCPGGIVQKSAGRLKSTLLCGSCGAGKDFYEEFNCLQWQIPVSPNVLLLECQEQFFQEESIPLEERWLCSYCGLVSEASKKLAVAGYPEILIVQLKRFNFVGGQTHKSDQEVGIQSMIVVGDRRYSLVGVVKHSGSRNSGHYVAEVKPDLEWYHCNDMSTETFMRESIVWCRQAYILFFKLQLTDCSQEAVQDAQS